MSPVYIVGIVLACFMVYAALVGATREYLKVRFKPTEFEGDENAVAAIWPFYWTYRLLRLPFEVGEWAVFTVRRRRQYIPPAKAVQR